MDDIPNEVYEYVEEEFKNLADEFFDKPFNSDSLSELRRKVTVMGIETGVTCENRRIQVLVEPTSRIAYLFVEECNEHF